jgi:hypothetical protein
VEEKVFIFKRRLIEQVLGEGQDMLNHYMAAPFSLCDVYLPLSFSSF